MKSTKNLYSKAIQETHSSFTLYNGKSHDVLSGWIIYIIIATFMSTNPPSGQSQVTADLVAQAYELRINGKIDEAKTILDDVLQRDSLNAMVNYEMSRMIKSIDPFQMDKIFFYLNRAIDNDQENVYYLFSLAESLHLKSYIEFRQQNSEQAKTSLHEAIQTFKKVISQDPKCKEALLYLAEIYALSPAEMGGDIEKAKDYAQQLKEIDQFYAARADYLFLQQEVGESEYWNKVIAETGENVDKLDMLSRAYLMEDDIANAKSCFQKILKQDPNNRNLLLDLARAHLLRVMKQKSKAEVELPLAKGYFEEYLEEVKSKPVLIEAWCFGFLSRIEKMLENQEGADQYLEKAIALYPNFSRAFAVPTIDCPPTELNFAHTSFFRPF